MSSQENDKVYPDLADMSLGSIRSKLFSRWEAVKNQADPLVSNRKE